MARKITEYSFDVGGQTYRVPIKYEEGPDYFTATFLTKKYQGDGVKEVKDLLREAAARHEGLTWTFWRIWDPTHYRSDQSIKEVSLGEIERDGDTLQLYSGVEVEDGVPRQCGDIRRGRPGTGLLFPWKCDPAEIAKRVREMKNHLHALDTRYEERVLTALGLHRPSHGLRELHTVDWELMEALQPEVLAAEVLKDTAEGVEGVRAFHADDEDRQS
jgi:hypothetical protein